MLKKYLEMWRDETGALISGELALVATIAVAGATAGLVALRDSVTSELEDLAGAWSSLDQSYSYSGHMVGRGGTPVAWTAGSGWRDDMVGFAGAAAAEVTDQNIDVLEDQSSEAASVPGSVPPIPTDSDRLGKSRQRPEKRRAKQPAEEGSDSSAVGDSADSDAFASAAGAWQTTAMPLPGDKVRTRYAAVHAVNSASDVVAVYPDCCSCGNPRCTAHHGWPAGKDICIGVGEVRVSDVYLSPKPCPQGVLNAAVYWGHVKPRKPWKHYSYYPHYCEPLYGWQNAIPVQPTVHGHAHGVIHHRGEVIVPADSGQPAVPAVPAVPHSSVTPAPGIAVATTTSPAAAVPVPALPVNAVPYLPVPAVPVSHRNRRALPYYVAPPNQHQPRFPDSVWNQ